MRPDNQGSVALTFVDNGIRFPEDIDFRNTKSLGMHLVVSPVIQLGGMTELDRNQGIPSRSHSGHKKRIGGVGVLANEKILIVEDEGIVSLHIKRTLEGLGYAVSGIACSAEDAIMKAMEDRPDLILMDIVLQGIVDGIDAAEKIRALFNIPVIYLTAHADESTLQRAKMSGPSGYIVKPFKERDLHIAVEFALCKAK